MIVNNKQENS